MKTISLNRWSNEQRKRFHKGTLEHWKFKILDQTGIDWNKMDALKDKGYLSFEEAKMFARNLGLKSCREWNIFCRSGDKPLAIPNVPNAVYKEWTNFNDWLGTNNVSKNKRTYLPFREARKFVRELDLDNVKEWFEWWKIHRPLNLPRNPHVAYKNCFKSYRDWIGK